MAMAMAQQCGQSVYSLTETEIEQDGEMVSAAVRS
jgi:hypothetical protein